MGQSRAAMVWGSVGESSCLLWLRPQSKAVPQGRPRRTAFQVTL